MSPGHKEWQAEVAGAGGETLRGSRPWGRQASVVAGEGELSAMLSQAKIDADGGEDWSLGPENHEILMGAVLGAFLGWCLQHKDCLKPRVVDQSLGPKDPGVGKHPCVESQTQGNSVRLRIPTPCSINWVESTASNGALSSSRTPEPQTPDPIPQAPNP